MKDTERERARSGEEWAGGVKLDNEPLLESNNFKLRVRTGLGRTAEYNYSVRQEGDLL